MKSDLQNTWNYTSSSYLHVKNKDITLSFDIKKNAFFGNDGCNNIFGDIKLNSQNALKFINIASTKMACEDMQSAYFYVQLLQKVSFYEIKNHTLLLFDKNKVKLLTFEK